MVGEAASVDRAGPGVVLSKVICRALDAVLLLLAGSVTLSTGIAAVTKPSAPGVRVNVKFWLAGEGARFEAVPPVTNTSPSVNVSGSIGSPKSTVTVTDAALVGEAASVDRVGPGGALSKVTRSTLEAVLLLSAMSMTLSAGISAVTKPSAPGVRVNVKVWLAEEWARFEVVPPVDQHVGPMRECGRVDRLAKVDCHGDRCRVGRGGRVSRQGGAGLVVTVEGDLQQHVGGGVAVVWQCP